MPRDQEPDRDPGVEEAARDETDGRHHYRDHEPVRERDAYDVAVDHRAGADEDQRERADELGDAAAYVVARHHRRGGYSPGRTAPLGPARGRRKRRRERTPGRG